MSMSVTSTVWTPPPIFTYAPERADEPSTLVAYTQPPVPGDEGTRVSSTITIEDIATLIYGIPTTITVSSTDTGAPGDNVASLNATYAGVVPGTPKQINSPTSNLETSWRVKPAAIVPGYTYETFHSHSVSQPQTSTPQTQTTFSWPTKTSHAAHTHHHSHFHPLRHRHGTHHTLRTHAFRPVPTRPATPYSYFLNLAQMVEEREMELNATYSAGSDALSRLGDALPYPNLAFMVFVFSCIALGFAWVSLVYYVNFPDACYSWIPQSRKGRKGRKKDGRGTEKERTCVWWPRTLFRRGKNAAHEGYDKIGMNGKKTKSKKPIDKPPKYVPVPLSSTSSLSSSSPSSSESAIVSATSTATPTYLRTQGSVNREPGTELRSRNRKPSKRYAASPSRIRDTSTGLCQSPTPVRLSAAIALPNMTALALGIRELEEQPETPATPVTAHVPNLGAGRSEKPTLPARTTSLGALRHASYASDQTKTNSTLFKHNGIESDLTLTPPPAPTITLSAYEPNTKDNKMHKRSASDTMNQNPCSSPENPYLPRSNSDSSSSSSSGQRYKPIRTSEEWLAARAAFSDGQRTPTRATSSKSLPAYSSRRAGPSTSNPYKGHGHNVDIEAQDTSKRFSWLSFGSVNADSNIHSSDYSSGDDIGSPNGNGTGSGWLNKVDDAVSGLVEKVARWTEKPDGDEGLLLPVAKDDKLG